MNRLTKQCLAFAIGFFGFLFILGIVGNLERTDEILYTMPNEVYMAIYEKLGHGCSKHQIVSEYEENKSYYDSLVLSWK